MSLTCTGKRKAFLLALALLASCSLVRADQTFTLVYLGNLNGELEPCGCAEESNLGGIRRQAFALDELRKQVPDIFVLSTGGFLTSEIVSDRIKSEFILKGLHAMRFDALGVQWRDLAYGTNLLASIPLAWVSSNAPAFKFPTERRVKHAGVELAVFSWLDPREAPPMGVAPTADSGELQAALRAARVSGAVTVLSTTVPLADAQKLVPLDAVDVLLVRPVDENYGEPRLLGNTLVLQPGIRGMRQARVDVVLDNARRVKSFKQSVRKLASDVPDAAALDGWYADYTAKLKEDYLARVEIRKALNAGNTDFVGADTCKTCHAKEHDIWSATKHAHAFEKLEGVNKIFDPNCVGCHVVGYDKPGGYIDPSLTSHLIGVQCENCHGAARAHVDSGGAKPVANKGWAPTQMCGQCHVGSHSPAFAFDKYWPKIQHGRR